MLTAASVCVDPEYRHTTPLCCSSSSKAFSERDALPIHSNVDVQEQNKMLADSAEGARREVPQLMQVRRSVHAEDEDEGGDEDDSSQVGLVGRLMRVRKGELVIMMLERVARLMRVRQRKGVGTSSTKS